MSINLHQCGLKIKRELFNLPTSSSTIMIFLHLEQLGLLVTADLHLVQFVFLPLVHRDGPDKGQVNPEAAMFPGTFQTDPDAVGDRHPLGVVGVTLETFLSIIAHYHYT